jgi:hypothetical protein
LSHCRDGRHRTLFLALSYLLVLAAWPGLPSPAAADAPQPLVAHVFPAGAQRGKTIEATVSGTNLQGALGVHLSGQGVAANVLKVEKPDTVRISVAVAADAPLGERDLRVWTPGGISNRYRFMVGDLPEVNEVEPNNSPAQAQRLPALPVLVNGQILENDRDDFRFAAKAGQTVVCALEGRTLLPYIPDAVPGWLDACLTLLDADGRELSYVDDFHLGPDPVLIFTAPKDGEYVVEVRDVLFRGRPAFVYRLSIGALPYVTSLFPLGGQRGTTPRFELRGVNLPATSMELPLGAEGPPLRFFGPLAGGLASNRLPLAVDDWAEIPAGGSNHAPAQAQRVGVPAAINGRIPLPGQSDYFIFAAQAAQTLAMEVQARRLGSPLDSMLYLYNAKAQELARNDDWQDPDPGMALLVHHLDSRLVYTFPAAGDYVLRIKDVQRNAGEDYAYRLTIAPPRPDFALLVSPDNPRLGRGDTAVLTLKAIRKDGFGGEIRVAARDLPQGFTASEAIVPAGQDTARMTITAPGGGPAGIVTLALAGTGVLGQQPLVRPVQPAEEIMQAFSIKHNVPTQELTAAVVEPSLLVLATSVPPERPLEVRREGEMQVVIKATRLGDAKGPVALSLDSPPGWLTVKPSPAAIPADKQELTLTLGIKKDAPAGARQDLFFSGTLNTGKETVTRQCPAVPIKVQ